MQQVETDLLKSKQAREKQAKEFSRQIEEENHRHQHEASYFFLVRYCIYDLTV